MNDFTLVIPTYNRPCELAALLRYLKAHEITHDWNTLVLDSSPKPVPTGVHTVRYPSNIDSFDKFRLGLGYVQTEYCALLADDDLYIPEAIEACLKAMRENPNAAMATGWSFSYDEHLQLKDPARKNLSITDADPFVRLARLFEHYHALTYGVYRTDVLQRVLY
jgi:glycosyltransferase domain-containing protein